MTNPATALHHYAGLNSSVENRSDKQPVCIVPTGRSIWWTGRLRSERVLAWSRLMSSLHAELGDGYQLLAKPQETGVIDCSGHAAEALIKRRITTSVAVRIRLRRHRAMSRHCREVHIDGVGDRTHSGISRTYA